MKDLAAGGVLICCFFSVLIFIVMMDGYFKLWVSHIPGSVGIGLGYGLIWLVKEKRERL